MIPVIFTHRGNQDYVKIAIEQAKRHNERVVLLGDETNESWDVEHHHITNYFTDDARHVSDYYVHMCSNPHDFELYNLQEFFVLREFMRQENLSRIFACDSDVMIYANLTNEEKRYGDYLGVYSIPQKQWEYRWSASAHSVYWTFPGLCAFCLFVGTIYRENLGKLEEKWRWHQENGVGGGICDMTLLWLFYRENLGYVYDICRVWKDEGGYVAFDHNIRVAENAFPDEYRMDGELKEVRWIANNQPYCWHQQLERWVRFATLHFQDGAKPKMGEYSKERI